MAQTEREHQQRAFELYYAQGGKRSLDRVAKELGVAVATVKSWSRQFQWSKRLAERDASVARQVADQAIRSEVDELGRNKKLVQMALIKVAKAINADKAKVQVGDLDRLIRLQTFLAGGYAPVTTEALDRMRPIEVVHVFDQWLSLLTDVELHELIAQLRAEAAATRQCDAQISPGATYVECHARERPALEIAEFEVESEAAAEPTNGIPK